MNSDTDKVLRQRQKDGDCIICGKEIKEQDVISLHHFTLGNVMICERHIKNGGD